MIKKDLILNIFTTTIIFVVSILLIALLSMSLSILKIQKKDYYNFGKDKVPSIYKVVGKRNLYYYRANNSDGKMTKTYKYKNVADVNADLSSYVNELKNNYYISTSEMDLSYDYGSFQLSNNSIIVDIEYNSNSYTIKITKGL